MMTIKRDRSHYYWHFCMYITGWALDLINKNGKFWPSRESTLSTSSNRQKLVTSRRQPLYVCQSWRKCIQGGYSVGENYFYIFILYAFFGNISRGQALNRFDVWQLKRHKITNDVPFRDLWKLKLTSDPFSPPRNAKFCPQTGQFLSAAKCLMFWQVATDGLT